jgi:hypothetical protein
MTEEVFFHNNLWKHAYLSCAQLITLHMQINFMSCSEEWTLACTYVELSSEFCIAPGIPWPSDHFKVVHTQEHVYYIHQHYLTIYNNISKVIWCCTEALSLIMQRSTFYVHVLECPWITLKWSDVVHNYNMWQIQLNSTFRAKTLHQTNVESFCIWPELTVSYWSMQR